MTFEEFLNSDASAVSLQFGSNLTVSLGDLKRIARAAYYAGAAHERKEHPSLYQRNVSLHNDEDYWR